MEFLGLDWWVIVIIVLAGFWAGTINSVVGSGTLVTFPVLVSLGFPPVTAQISNAMGLVAAGFSGTFGYRRELRESWGVVPRLTLASLLGGFIGAMLLLMLPESVFGIAAPLLIIFAILFVVFQPRLSLAVRQRKQSDDAATTSSVARPVPEVPTPPISPTLWVLVFVAGIYGGYFVAAQGVLLLGILGVFLSGSLLHANAIKTWLSLCVNLIAAISYLLFSFDRIDWRVVLLIAVSSLMGGSLGAKIGRRIKPLVLRMVIVVVGLAGLINMVWRLFN